MTYAQVNAKLAPYGVELVRGNGYHYFVDTGDAFNAGRIQSVYTPRLRDLTLAQWVDHVESAIGDPSAALLAAAEELLARLDNGDTLDTSALREAVERIREVTP